MELALIQSWLMKEAVPWVPFNVLVQDPIGTCVRVTQSRKKMECLDGTKTFFPSGDWEYFLL